MVSDPSRPGATQQVIVLGSREKYIAGSVAAPCDICGRAAWYADDHTISALVAGATSRCLDCAMADNRAAVTAAFIAEVTARRRKDH